jgi:transaldolase
LKSSPPPKNGHWPISALSFWNEVSSNGGRLALQKASSNTRFLLECALCFSQQQAAAVYGATKGARAPVYASPFVGRLDDIGQNGMDLVRNIKRMFAQSDGHVLLLAASIRTLEHLLYCFALDVDLLTAPAKILTAWADKGLPLPEANYEYRSTGKPITYEELDLTRPWESFGIAHELTTKGLEKFATDYRKTLAESAD